MVVNPLPSMIQMSTMLPIEVKVGSAVIFVLDVERFVRY
ncbi:MAG: cyclic-di-AMP receptor [Anaerolineae bacterium]|nr:cyclic-di-AMP receptor [Anaerolineae bacterium]